MPLVQAGSAITSALLNALGIQAVIKPTSQSVTSSTTLVNDNALVLPVLADVTYAFKCFLAWEAGTAGSSDIKWQWSVPSGATLLYTAPHVNAGGGSILNTVYSATSSVTGESGGSGNMAGCLMAGTLVMSTTAGDIQLEWAQSTSSATATQVLAGSSLELWETVA